MQFDVCNGDADGLCAVVQLRLQTPLAAKLVTGLKRDIALLSDVHAHAGDSVLVCDLSMRRNLADLTRLLRAGVRVQYFDHHAVDAIPEHPLLEAHIDCASDACTSLLVDRYLGGRFRAWAVVGAFGDNLPEVAHRMGAERGIAYGERQRLRMLGEAINYNAYGATEQDVYIAPGKLFEILLRFPDPLALLEREGIGQALNTLRLADVQRAAGVEPYFQDGRTRVYLLPDMPWSRRVMGCWINQLALEQRQRAHAVLRATSAGDYTVSVRAPLDCPQGAVQFCRQFGGDGRASAAGIDHLPANRLVPFVEAFCAVPWSTPDRTLSKP